MLLQKHKLACTEPWQCGGDEEICANPYSLLPEDDEEDDEVKN